MLKNTFVLPILLILFGLSEITGNDSDQNSYGFFYNDANQRDALLSYSNQEDGWNDELCSSQMLNFLIALSKRELWAIQVADSWGKIPSGILSGNAYVFGDFDQCMAIAQESNQTEIETNFNGQYCLSSLSINIDSASANAIMDSISINVGVCVPKTCSVMYLNHGFNQLLELIGNVTQIKNVTKVSFKERLCHNTTKHDYDPMDIFAVVFFSVIAVLMISSTAYDLVMTRQKKIKSQNLIAFSIYTNGEKLFKCKPSVVKSADLMECLNGIRVLSITWVVFGHTYSSFLGATINSAYMLDWLQNPYFTLVFGAEFAVDTFFLLSGLLVTFSMLKHLDSQKGKLNIALLYIHRYLRLTPALAASVLFYTTIFRHLLSGPVWKIIDPAGCTYYWWSTLLYVQNYVNPNNVCLGPTWYLMVDMQLFILSPIIIYPLWRWRNKVSWTIPILILLSMSCTFSTFMINHYRVGKFVGRDDEGKFEKTYVSTHTRFGAWGIGVLLGYILHLNKTTKSRYGKTFILCGWIISLGTILATIFGNFPLNQPNAITTDLENAFYESFSRVCWAIAIGWIIFACVHDYGGPINWFLSLRQWQPLARLSYCIYLLHTIVQMVKFGSKRTSEYFSDFDAIHKFWGDFGITICISVIWTLAFESPIIILEKLLLGGNKSKIKQNKSQECLTETKIVE